MPVLLAIDDDASILDCFRYVFPEPEVTLLTARSAAEGYQLFAQRRPDAVILDVRLPDLSGLEAFRRLHGLDDKIPVILVTGHGSAETAIEAMRLGAYDYVVKPLDPDHLTELVGRAFEVSRLRRVPAIVPHDRPAEAAADLLIGSGPAMQGVYKAIGRVAPQDVTVLILGESGTGKELVARAIYHYSGRAAGPFLAINCAAIPETLLESELFGHEKGAFTGADRKRIGKFEQCSGGTLFLDEIGDMTPLTQAKILRVLQEQRFERVGGNETVHTDVRLIAATNRDLERLMAAKTFRADLYYRLNVYMIRLPPLRERGGDLPLLAEYFLNRFSRDLGKEVRGIAPEALALLSRYRWPGNVRELESTIKQALLETTGPVLGPESLPAALRSAGGDGSSLTAESQPGQVCLTRFIRQQLQAGSTTLYAELLEVVERQLLTEVLRHTSGNQSQAARILGITRPTLRAKLVALGLSAERFASEDGRSAAGP
jgi:two-component system, NtrC family, nitrogen regulation response regulator GlnG